MQRFHLIHHGHCAAYIFYFVIKSLLNSLGPYLLCLHRHIKMIQALAHQTLTARNQ